MRSPSAYWRKIWLAAPRCRYRWTSDLPLRSRSQLLALQTALNVRGFDSGTPDKNITEIYAKNHSCTGSTDTVR
jgi:hypothetical protein